MIDTTTTKSRNEMMVSCCSIIGAGNFAARNRPERTGSAAGRLTKRSKAVGESPRVNKNSTKTDRRMAKEEQHDASSSSSCTEMDAKECKVREKAKHNAAWLLLYNSYSTGMVLVFHLITLESVVSVLLGVSLTLYLFYTTTEENIQGNSMNWVLLSFAVITPLASSVSMAFARREQALSCIAVLRATLLQMYLAHAVWDWGKGTEDSPSGKCSTSLDAGSHSATVLHVMDCLQKDLVRFLTMPNGARARHRTTRHGRGEAQEIEGVSAPIYGQIVSHLSSLSRLCEDLKRVGLPGNEASRIRQWEHGLLSEIEKLRMIKRYRTPQGLRSFGRCFSIFLPPLYAPYYVYLARDLNSLSMGITFSILTSIALTALFETVSALEDPFETRQLLDGIHVEEELLSTVVLRAEHEKLFPLEVLLDPT